MSYKKMDLKVKKRWLKALRSGEYKQGRAWLCTEDAKGTNFCCLGVLVDIEYDGDWDFIAAHPDDYHDGTWGIPDGDSPCSNRATLPRELRQRCELSTKAVDRLMDMNDSGNRFKTIANWIEKNL